jgi:beta-phosphoglucomutase
MISTILLDFDGVILESVSVKTEVFRTLFSFVPNHVDEIVQFHEDNGGMSRFDKFRHIYTTILHEDLSKDQFEKLSRRFSVLVEDAVAQAPFVDGALDFLDTMSQRYQLYIVSATPQDELKRIVDQKGISPYFSGVFGSPTKKIDHILKIVTDKNLSPKEVLFVGDAVNDWDAAQKSGIGFIGRIKPGDPNRFANLPDVEYTITTLHDLIKYLEGKKC